MCRSYTKNKLTSKQCFNHCKKSMHIEASNRREKKPYSHLPQILGSSLESNVDVRSFKTCHKRKIPNCDIIKTFHLLPWSLRTDYLNYRRSKKNSDLWRLSLRDFGIPFAWIFGTKTHDLDAKEISRNYVVKVQYKNNNESFVVWVFQFPRSNILIKSTVTLPII